MLWDVSGEECVLIWHVTGQYSISLPGRAPALECHALCTVCFGFPIWLSFRLSVSVLSALVLTNSPYS